MPRPTRSPPRPKRKPTLPILVIECDPDKLERDNLSQAKRVRSALAIGSPLIGAIRRPATRRALDADVVSLRTQQEWLSKFADLSQRWGRVEAILIVGHSNSAGIVAANDLKPTWAELGKWLAELRPRRIGLMACMGGGPSAVGSLLPQIACHFEVVGSPVTPTSASLMPLLA